MAQAELPTAPRRTGPLASPQRAPARGFPNPLGMRPRPASFSPSRLLHLAPPASARAEPPAAASAQPEAMPVNRLLDCIAGFFGREQDALQALIQLRRSHALLPSQLVLLGPGDAAAARFQALARQWARGRQPWQGDRWVAAGVGGLLAGMLATAWLALDLGVAPEWQVLLMMAAVVPGAMLGVALATLWKQPPRLARFDQNVQRQLAGGHWAVVAHGVPWASQAGVLAQVRTSSLKWCAVAPSSGRL